jgi:hypothetical protein
VLVSGRFVLRVIARGSIFEPEEPEWLIRTPE